MPKRCPEIIRYGESAAHPRWDSAFFTGGRPDNSLDVLYPYQFKQPSRKPERIAGLQTGDEPFLDGTKVFATQELYAHHHIGHNGPDTQPMPHGNTLAGHFIHTAIYDYFVKLFVRIQCAAALGHHQQAFVKFIAVDGRKAVGLLNLVI